ncbi:O-fucosyltransferase 29 [Citrus sinensis]|uniref:O-fucosyltransferase 29 n=1 Tax=Citrus sinensis TaxID=2711 RepID=A0ACB8LV99_CITSI|nr:O-fucosyltransferase 29 [Citrus sinensis]
MKNNSCLIFFFFPTVVFTSNFLKTVTAATPWSSLTQRSTNSLSRKPLQRHQPIDIWKSRYSKYYHGCSERRKKFPRARSERSSNGYLLIAASGGLNQQRTGITDAVVVARILNATLVVPELDHHSYWKDDSDFANIFDVDHFISSLAKDVTIVKRVPDKVMRSMEKPPYTMRVPRKSTPEYYLDQVLPILLRRRVVQLTKFDYRLANDLDEELQKMRCRVNYHALRFTKPIEELGQKLVMRMRSMAKRFIAVHLRFEPDMLAFSGCYYGGGDKERYELGEIRKRWATLPDLSPEGERKRGKCPLTPHEVGLMLRALGFANDTHLYVASGEIYGGEETLRPLRELFPNFYTKEMLANEELKPFLQFSSRLAAIDYIVCDESDVFVTNNNGNMAKILAGRRRYMGHKRTIRPNAKRLSALFMAKNQMDWDTFARKVKSCQRGFMGEPEEMKPGRGEFHEFPYSCICEKPVTDEEHTDRDHHLDKASAHLIAKLQSKDREKKGEKKFKKKGLVEEQITSVHIEGEELFPD